MFVLFQPRRIAIASFAPGEARQAKTIDKNYFNSICYMATRPYPKLKLPRCVKKVGSNPDFDGKFRFLAKTRLFIAQALH
jgi:hypothetical protein